MRLLPIELAARTRTQTTVVQSHIAQKPVLRGLSGCACAARVKLDRGWVVQARAVSAMRFGIGVAGHCAR